jgi:hypothetical protein
MRFVLANSALDVAGDSNVEYPPLTTQDVNVVRFFHVAIIRSRVLGVSVTRHNVKLWISHFECHYL